MTLNCVKLLHLTINNATGYIEESNGNKHFTLIPTNEGKDTFKKHEKVCSKIKDLSRSINHNYDDYDEKYTKIKFNSDDDFPLKRNTKIARHNNSCFQ